MSSLRVQEPRILESPPGAVPFISPNVALESAVRKQSPLRPRELFGSSLRHAGRILGSGPAFWRTFEAFAIAMVFCALAGVSIRRVSALPIRTSHPAEQQNASRRATPAAKVLALADQPVLTLNSRRQTEGEANVVAEDTVIHYQKRGLDLRGPAMRRFAGGAVQAQLLPPENLTVKPAVRFTVGRDADNLAADTVIRYGANSSAPAVQHQKTAALDPQGDK